MQCRVLCKELGFIYGSGNLFNETLGGSPRAPALASWQAEIRGFVPNSIIPAPHCLTGVYSLPTHPLPTQHYNTAED